MSSSIVALRRLILNRSFINQVHLSTYSHLQVDTPTKHVAHIRLNRTDKLNAINPPLWSEIGQIFNELSDDSECRAIVLSGNGRSFCAGIDLREGFAELQLILQNEQMDVARKARHFRKIVSRYQQHFCAPERCTKPVIAAIHGHCIGAGINLVASCDIRYAANDALFSIKEVDIGLAADVGILNRINRLVGSDSLTRELAFTARNFNASEAFNSGFVSRTFSSADDCIAGSIALAQTIALKSPIAVQGTKLTLNYARDHTIDDSINFVLTWNQSQLQTEDLIKSTMATMSKGKITPDFNNV